MTRDSDARLRLHGKPGDARQDPLQVEVVMTHPSGLHARPSVKFTKLAKSFPCLIELGTTADGPWVDAKSIVKVMATRIPMGTTMYLRARGVKATEALVALAALVSRRFDEDGHSG